MSARGLLFPPSPTEDCVEKYVHTCARLHRKEGRKAVNSGVSDGVVSRVGPGGFHLLLYNFPCSTEGKAAVPHKDFHFTVLPLDGTAW